MRRHDRMTLLLEAIGWGVLAVCAVYALGAAYAILRMVSYCGGSC